MKDVMTNGGAFSHRKLSNLSGSAEDTNTSIWTTIRINKLLDDIENDGFDIKGLHNSPFKDNDINLKRGNLPFEYTPEEWEELKKCKANILYFATNYCKIQTGDGIKFIKDTEGLRDFQEEILRSFKGNKFNILMASRQTGKSVTSAIFILWYLLFNSDKTALIVADNFTTTRELLDKFRICLDGLPFFMKPGIKHINSGNIKFDNDSRVVGRTTTKKSGIGLSVNVLYIDEFAHIDEAKLDEFYRAILPTITADPNAKVIITSTPNGKNKFYEIWVDAVAGKSDYVPLRVDWWQVKGRDESWKQAVIANMGSVEDFNQEYGLQFFSSDQLLLNSNELKRLYNIKSDYINTSFALPEEKQWINECFTVHPNYANRLFHDYKNDRAKYVFSIDTADGTGGDYSVLNIYKIVCLPVNELLKKKEAIRGEVDTTSLVQVATFRTNEYDINQFAAGVEFITYELFNPDNVRIVLEMNHKGEIIKNRLEDNDSYWPSQLVHTKHTEMAVNVKPGLRLGPTNKIRYCEKFKYFVEVKKIIPNDFLTVMELMAFGKTKGGSYRGQNGNDDLAMTCVNLAPALDSNQLWELCIETYESSPEEYRKDVEEKIFNLFRSGNSRPLYDYDVLRKANVPANGAANDNQIKRNVFDLEALEKMKKIKGRFFKD
ncbi:large terminase protein [uncultured Caudovirales phage]|uniref:Large terminase protein n=1 Tax=uncultured Caudovirales phage TaxID=2100421 RepID=A0A6J5NP99_9CAUD|nr:large terminase protein [uncultured Caudovirales phage]